MEQQGLKNRREGEHHMQSALVVTVEDPNDLLRPMVKENIIKFTILDQRIAQSNVGDSSVHLGK